MKIIGFLLLLILLLSSCTFERVTCNKEGFMENMAKIEEKMQQDSERKDAEAKQRMEQNLIKMNKEEDQRNADDKRLYKSMEATANRLPKSTKLHAVKPINGSDLEEWREALKIGGFPFHPISGRYTFSGDVTIIELYCVDNSGKRVFVETTIIGDKTIVKMEPRYVRIRE